MTNESDIRTMSPPLYFWSVKNHKCGFRDFTDTYHWPRRKLFLTDYWPNTDLSATPMDLSIDIPEGSTWSDVRSLCFTLLEQAGDKHHVYVESFSEYLDGYMIHTGS